MKKRALKPRSAFEEEQSNDSFIPMPSIRNQNTKHYFRKQKYNFKGKVMEHERLDSKAAERLYQHKHFQRKHRHLHNQLAEAQLHNDFVTVQNRKGQIPMLVMRPDSDPVLVNDDLWMERQNSLIEEVKKVVGEEDETSFLEDIQEQLPYDEDDFKAQEAPARDSAESSPASPEEEKLEHVSVFELMNKLENEKDWSYINILISYLEREGPLWYNGYPGLFERMSGIIIEMNTATVDRLEEVYNLCTVWPHLMYKNFPKYSKIKRENKQIVSAIGVGFSLEEHYSQTQKLLIRTPSEKCCNEAIVAALSIPLDVGFGSKGSIEMLRSLERCKNDNIFKIPVIQGYLSYKWKQSLYFLVIEAGLYSIFLLLFNLFVLDSRARKSYVVQGVLLIYWAVFVMREVIQGIGRRKDYFLDVWNYIDMGVLLCLIGSVVSELLSSPETWFMVVCLILMWTKLVSYFRLWDSTRYLIRTILEIIKDMGPFLLIFLVMILCFACALASTFPDEDFSHTSFLERMYEVYNLVLGNPIH